MSGTKKTALLILGALSAVLIIAQVVMGRLILSGSALQKAHEHSGYLTVLVTLLYIGLSLTAIMSAADRGRTS